MRISHNFGWQSWKRSRITLVLWKEAGTASWSFSRSFFVVFNIENGLLAVRFESVRRWIVWENAGLGYALVTRFLLSPTVQSKLSLVLMTVSAWSHLVVHSTGIVIPALASLTIFIARSCLPSREGPMVTDGELVSQSGFDRWKSRRLHVDNSSIRVFSGRCHRQRFHLFILIIFIFPFYWSWIFDADEPEGIARINGHHWWFHHLFIVSNIAWIGYGVIHPDGPLVAYNATAHVGSNHLGVKSRLLIAGLLRVTVSLNRGCFISTGSF